jgi:hypothetical protein
MSNQYTIDRDDGTNIRFIGKRIGSASTSPETARSDYSGSTGRWQELELYRTAGDKFVCSRMNGTQWQGEHDTHEATSCATEAEVIAFFGMGRLAKELYAEAGIECIEDVE